jgi:hypothetical protein
MCGDDVNFESKFDATTNAHSPTPADELVVVCELLPFAS